MAGVPLLLYVASLAVMAEDADVAEVLLGKVAQPSFGHRAHEARPARGREMEEDGRRNKFLSKGWKRKEFSRALGTADPPEVST